MRLLRAIEDLGAMPIKGTLHSLKLQHYWSLTIRLLSVISRTLVGEGITLCREEIDEFYCPTRLSKFKTYVLCFICVQVELQAMNNYSAWTGVFAGADSAEWAARSASIIFCERCPWCNGYRRRKWTRRHSSNPGRDLLHFI